MVNNKNKKLLKLFMVASGISLLCTYVAFAAPQAKMQASVNQPKMRSAYTNQNNVKLEGDISLSRGNQIISVSLRDSDVKQALRMFADKAGLNIIFHSSVEGKVTLDLVNVTLNNAFKMIMQMSDLSYVINNDTLMVMSAEASKNINVGKENMSVIPVKYVDANSVAKFLNSNIFTINKPGLSNSEIVVTNPSKNELLIFGTDNDYRMAKKIVEKLDVKPQATTYKVNHTTPKEMATLICDTLFASQPKAEKKEGDAGSSTSDGTTTGGASPAPAAAPQSPAAAPSSGGSGGTTAKLQELSLGGGVVACRVSNSVKTDKLASLESSNISVIYHSGLGAITIFGGSPEQINMVNEFIAANDRKQPQALIEVSIVELGEEGSKEFENSWQIAANDFSASFNMTDGFSTSPVYWKGNNVVNTAYVTQTIKYLITNKKARQLANPKVIVTNGKQSTIDLTTDYIEKVDAQVLATSGGMTGGVQRTYTIAHDLGIKVDLIPFISPDGYVSMNMKPNYSVVGGNVIDSLDTGGTEATQYLAATLLSRRNLDLSNVRIKDGETLVLGGLTKEEEIQEVTKIPVLGDIPYVGVIFRGTKKTVQKRELVIMLTPRIIKDSEDVTRI